MSEVKHVFRAITAVTAAMAKEGIGKARKNEQQNYRFRGIDDVYNAIAGHLATNSLCMLPYVHERSMTERPTKTGGVSSYVVLTVDFHLISSLDGSSFVIRTMGEAMDTADKATNKAMSAAMKYACLMAFQIPTEGDNDTENAHHEAADKPANTNGSTTAAKPDNSDLSLELELQLGFETAKDSGALAAIEARTAKEIQAGKLDGKARDRLRTYRANAVKRLAEAS